MSVSSVALMRLAEESWAHTVEEEDPSSLVLLLRSLRCFHSMTDDERTLLSVEGGWS